MLIKNKLSGLKGFYNKLSVNDFTYGNDNTMTRYTNIINNKCNNKCSNKCSNKNEYINLNEITKEYNNLCIEL